MAISETVPIHFTDQMSLDQILPDATDAPRTLPRANAPCTDPPPRPPFLTIRLSEPLSPMLVVEAPPLGYRDQAAIACPARQGHCSADTVADVVLRAINRKPVLDGLDLYRRLDSSNPEVAINDPERVESFLAELRSGLSKALSTPTTVAGWRTQALFASMVAALDGCTMMTQVDVGEVLVDGESVKAPDFFLHLRDGRRILVDVKHVEQRPETMQRAVTFAASEISRLRRFAELYGAEVYLALYFTGVPCWALVTLDDLQAGPGSGYRISFIDAFARNQTAVLGDLTIGVTPPLEVEFGPDPNAENSVDADGHASFRLGSVEVRSGGRRVATEEGQRIVMFLMAHGDWPTSKRPIVRDEQIVTMTWRSEPEQEVNPGERFELIGSLSTMYARMFEAGTTGANWVTALDIAVEPGALVSLIPHDYDSDDLPLWRLEVVPSDGISTPDEA